MRKYLLATLRPFGATWDFLRHYPVLPVFILIVVVLAAIFGPLVAPYDRDIGQSINGQLPPFSYTRVTVAEGDETIDVFLSGTLPSETEFAPSPTATITIADDDGNLITISETLKETKEDNAETSTYTVSCLCTLEFDLEIKVLLGGTANAGKDYMVNDLQNFRILGLPGILESGNVLLIAGQFPEEQFTITVLDDSLAESNEKVSIELSGSLPVGFKFAAKRTSEMTIVDDDSGLPTDTLTTGPTDEISDLNNTTIDIFVEEPTVLEGSSGETTPVSFVVESNGRLDQPLEISLTIAGTGTLGTDYLIGDGIGDTGKVTLPAGENTRVTIPLQIIGDDDTEIDFAAINSPIRDWWPEGYYLFGTDQNGRDLFTRLLHGAQISMLVVFVALIAGMVLGTALGIAAGYLGGVLDELITRFVDIWYALPFLLVALVVTLIFGRGLNILMIVLALVAWAGFVRIIRAQVLVIKQLDYVDSARINGASDLRIMWRHIFPGVLNTAVVVATLNTSGLILGEAVLSFVGAGIQPPTPSWGVMASEGRDFVILGAPHISLIPGFAIFLIVLAFNFFGDWLRDRLDPRLRQIG